jgi:NADPH:quinone reductase-like Zn-dependent oxidoreductase
MRSGAAKEQFPMHFPEVLGVDIAGEVEQVGSGVQGPA